MPSIDLQEITRRLSKLSQSELSMLKTLVNYNLRGSFSQKIQDEEEDELFLFYSQISIVLSEKGIISPPWNIFKRTATYQTLKKRFPEIESYTKTYFGKLSRRNRQRLYRIYSLAIIHAIETNPYVPVTPKIVLQSAYRVPEHMHAAFPGYAENGLLPVVLDLVEDRKSAGEQAVKLRHLKRRKKQ